MEKITDYCPDCKKDLTLNSNDWSNHEMLHKRTVMKKELFKLEHPNGL